MDENKNKKPSMKARIGSIQVAEWTQKGMKDGREYFVKNYTFNRSYTDKDGNWQTSNSYALGDLWKLRAIIDKILANQLNSENVSDEE